MRGAQTTPTTLFVCDTSNFALSWIKAIILKPTIDSLHSEELNESLSEVKGYVERREETRLSNRLQDTYSRSSIKEDARGKGMTLPGKSRA
jgi:hypothetical protein